MPAWSPDGAQIAFVSNRSGSDELYIMNADGSNVVRKTLSAIYPSWPAWSPDGSKIAYSTVSNGSLNIWVVGTAANSTPAFFYGERGFEDHASWSPDGSKIALYSDYYAYDLVWDIFTINADGSNFKVLNIVDLFDFHDYYNPSWSPSGSKIALQIVERLGIDQYIASIGVINNDGSGLKAIIPNAAPFYNLTWNNNGSKILFTSVNGSQRNVSWVASDGSASGTIIQNAWNADWQK